MNNKNLDNLLNEYNQYIGTKPIKEVNNIYISKPIFTDDNIDNVEISSEKEILIELSDMVNSNEYDQEDVYFIITQYFDLNKDEKSLLINLEKGDSNEKKILNLLVLLFNHKYIRFFYIINDFLYINDNKRLFDDIEDILREKKIDNNDKLKLKLKFLIENLYDTYSRLVDKMSQSKLFDNKNINIKNYFYNFIFKNWYKNYKLKLLATQSDDNGIFSILGSCNLICS